MSYLQMGRSIRRALDGAGPTFNSKQPCLKKSADPYGGLRLIYETTKT
jgi:hypothetical protein